ncbi:TPR protein [Arachis hypogaea]|nr:TPR protein [Arachis hypogaea]
MFRIASSRLSSRAASSVSSTASFLASLTAKPSPVSLTPLAATSFRSYGNGLELDKSMANPDAINMINYALNHARTDKSFGSYGLGLLVLKHCLTIELTEGKDPKNENSKGIALLAMSTLEYERGEYDIALEKLQSIHELTNAYLGVRVAALEAEAGLYLELGQDDKASAIADKCVEVVEKQKTDDDDEDFKALILRAKALKGLIELVKGSIESAVPFFDKSIQLSDGTAALSYGEFLYLKQNYSMAKEVYTSVLKGASDIKKFGNPYLGACNMNLEGLMMGALCSLGQLETYQGYAQFFHLVFLSYTTNFLFYVETYDTSLIIVGLGTMVMQRRL